MTDKSNSRIWVVSGMSLDYDDYAMNEHVVAVFDSREQAEGFIAGRSPGRYRTGYRAACYRLNEVENNRDFHESIY